MRGHVFDDGVGAACFGVQVGVRVVFGRSPESVALVPEDGPAGVVAEEAGNADGLGGRGIWGMGACRGYGSGLAS
jgi:hypothetical protein